MADSELFTKEELSGLSNFQLTLCRERRPALIRAIRSGASILHSYGLTFAEPVALLGALAFVESSFGLANRSRLETSWGPKGTNFDRSQFERWQRWGSLSQCSFSSFQIMYGTACELGFDSSPWKRNPLDLFDDEIAIHFVTQYIKRRIIDRGAKTIQQFADAYNSGSFKDRFIPEEYIGKIQMAYARVLGLYPVLNG